MPPLLYLFPTFPFCRVIFLSAMECAYSNCFGSTEFIPDEIVRCIWALAIHAVVLLVLALYLYQVIPQTYGVPKHPCFCLKKIKKLKKVDEKGKKLKA